MKKLSLNISSPLWSSEELNEVLSLERLFHSMKISLDGLCDEKILRELSRKHGARVKMLILKFVAIENVESFREILKNYPLLEHLHIHRMQFQCSDNDHTSADQTVNLKKLKFLKIEESSHLVLTLINKALISSQNIVILWSIEDYLGCNFLVVSSQLTKLEVTVLEMAKIFTSDLSRDLSFKLKSLYVTRYWPDIVFCDENVSENFNQFLNAQKDSITDIDITGISGIKWVDFHPGSFKILELIFTDLPHLTSLKFDLFSFSYMRESDAYLFHSLKSNMSLRNLNCGIGPVSKIFANEMLSKCPGIETLVIYCNDCDLLPFLAVHNPKLKSLALREVDNPASATLKFEFLEKFSVLFTGKRKLWLSFVMNNSSIKSLGIEYQDKSFKDKTLCTLKTHANLKVFNGKELVFEKVMKNKLYLWCPYLFRAVSRFPSLK